MAAWVPPDRHAGWLEAQVDDVRPHSLTYDGGARYKAFWTWVDSRAPGEPLWLLDSVGVAPAWRGHGIGSALIRGGLARADAVGQGSILETGTATNVALYEHFGYRLVDEGDPPGGPHVWFMRRDS